MRQQRSPREARCWSPCLGSEMLVEESGDVFEAAEVPKLDDNDSGDKAGSDTAMGGAADELSAAGSLDNTPWEDKEEPLAFPIASHVIVNSLGKWSGVVTGYGRDSENFLTCGKYQVKYELKTKKGRGFTITSTSAWVAEHDLTLRVVSPRKASSAEQTAASKKGSAPASRPNTKQQPDFAQESGDLQEGGDSHPALAAHERGRKLQKKATETTSLLGERQTAETKKCRSRSAFVSSPSTV
jgi:hypothetical protein